MGWSCGGERAGPRVAGDPPPGYAMRPDGAAGKVSSPSTWIEET